MSVKSYLTYRYNGPTNDDNFDDFDNTFILFDKIKNGEIILQDAKTNQNRLKLGLNEIRKRNPRKKSNPQKNALYNIEKLYEFREAVFKFYGYYFSMVSESMHEATNGKGIKILTSKQMLQRLSIALAQVKPGNNSGNILNEIRQSVYSLYQSK